MDFLTRYAGRRDLHALGRKSNCAAMPLLVDLVKTHISKNLNLSDPLRFRFRTSTTATGKSRTRRTTVRSTSSARTQTTGRQGIARHFFPNLAGKSTISLHICQGLRDAGADDKDIRSDEGKTGCSFVSKLLLKLLCTDTHIKQFQAPLPSEV